MRPPPLPPSALLLALAACGAPEAAPSWPARSAVLVTVDSLRADRLSCYGYEQPTSPELDRLAREGVRFERAVAETSWTLPSHLTLFTGLSSMAHGVLESDAALAESCETVAELLAAQGFVTGGVWSGPYLHAGFGCAQGFDTWEGVVDTAPLDRGDFDPADGGEEPRKAINRANRISHASVTSPRVLARALEFLDGVGDRRFFLFVHFFDVHYDYVPPEEHWRLFDPDYAGDYTGERYVSDERVGPGMGRRLLRHVRARYDGEVHWVDAHLGELARGLEERGLARDTLLLVTSDHGDEFFEHGAKGHRNTLYEEVLAVPLVAWRPGALAAGRVEPAQVSHLDVAPTLLDALGVPVPADMRGASLLPALRGAGALPERFALAHLFDPDGKGGHWRAISRGGLKLVVRTDRSGSDELLLFDLRKDPGEQRTLDVLSRRAQPLFDQIAILETGDRALRARLAPTRSAPELPQDVLDALSGLGYTE